MAERVHFRIDVKWQQMLNGYAEFGVFRPERVGEAPHVHLRGGIHRYQRYRLQLRPGGYVDDRTPFTLLHLSDNQPRHQCGRAHIYVDNIP